MFKTHFLPILALCLASSAPWRFYNAVLFLRLSIEGSQEKFCIETAVLAKPSFLKDGYQEFSTNT